jgi:hypothetical protein
VLRRPVESALGRPVKPGDDAIKWPGDDSIECGVTAAPRPIADTAANALVLRALFDRIINSTAF